MIVSVARESVMGNKDKLPWGDYLPRDAEHFRNKTIGQIVVVGRKTWQSISKRIRPSAGRRDIVLSTNPYLHAPGASVCSSIEPILALAESMPVFISGGAEINKIFLPFARTIYVTRVHAYLNGKDLFPKLSFENWRKVSDEYHPADVLNKYDLTFETYVPI